MRLSLLAVAIGLCSAPIQAQTQPSGQPPGELSVPTRSATAVGTEVRLTLEEALRIAEAANANVRARETQLALGEGLRREAASPFLSNPELNVEQSRRRSPGGDSTDRTVGLSQAIETGGQQGRRREAAAATIEALRLELDDARRQARADAAARFLGVVGAQRRVEIEERALQLFDATSQAVARRRTAGEDTRLDANVALIEAERARNALGAARERLIDARAELATVLQLPPAQVPQVVLDPSVASNAARLSYRLDDLLTTARDLPRIRALASRKAAAAARLSVEQARRSPDVTVGVAVGREGPEGGRERVATLSLAVPFPVFNRNSAAIGQAVAELGQAEVEYLAGIRDNEANVRRLWLRLTTQRDRVARLQQALVAAAQDNQQLAARSRQAGQIGLLDQLVVNRQALDAERELIEAQAEFDGTRIELERAAGWPKEGQPQ